MAAHVIGSTVAWQARGPARPPSGTGGSAVARKHGVTRRRAVREPQVAAPSVSRARVRGATVVHSTVAPATVGAPTGVAADSQVESSGHRVAGGRQAPPIAALRGVDRAARVPRRAIACIAARQSPSVLGPRDRNRRGHATRAGARTDREQEEPESPEASLHASTRPSARRPRGRPAPLHPRHSRPSFARPPPRHRDRRRPADRHLCRARLPGRRRAPVQGRRSAAQHRRPAERRHPCPLPHLRLTCCSRARPPRGWRPTGGRSRHRRPPEWEWAWRCNRQPHRRARARSARKSSDARPFPPQLS